MKVRDIQYPTWRNVGLIGVPPVEQTLFEVEPVGSGYLYAAYRHGWVKIGYTVLPSRRMRELRATLIAISDRDKSKRDEARVHAMLRGPALMAHEWYHPTPEVMAWVQRLPHQVAPVLHLTA